jgi:lysophospholipase
MADGWVQISGNPEPEGLAVRKLTGAGGKAFRVGFAPLEGARGTVAVLPGRTECIEKYFEIARDIQGMGYAVALVEPRGQGLSDRLAANPAAGHIDDFAHAAADLAQAVSELADMPRPLVVLGHSAGGGVVLRALLDGLIAPRAAIFCAPLWGLKLPPGADLLAKAEVAMGLREAFLPTVPTRSGPERFEGNHLTSDPRRHARANALLVAEPALGMAGPTAGWLVEAMEMCARFTTETVARLPIPVLTLVAGLEKLVDSDAARTLTEAMPAGRVAEFAGGLHELLMERDEIRAEVLAEIGAFLEQAAG